MTEMFDIENKNLSTNPNHFIFNCLVHTTLSDRLTSTRRTSKVVISTRLGLLM